MQSLPVDAPIASTLAIHRSRHLIAPFCFERPGNFAEARQLLDDLPQAVPMAGGLDLVTGMKTGAGPGVVVWLGGIPGATAPVRDGDAPRPGFAPAPR